MDDYEKAKPLTPRRASISPRFTGKNDVEGQPGAIGRHSNFGQQANWASSETLSSVGGEKNGVQITEQDLAPLESVSNSSKRGIDWRSPATMFLTFLIGLTAAVGQHIYYFSLAGDLVGCTDQQQRVLRYGTTFAFITQVSLAASVTIAATQCLWRSLRRANLCLSTIDAAFDSHNTMVPFLNVQLLTKLKLATFLALVAWCIPIASLITPATLSVDLSIREKTIIANVPSLNISDANQAHRYAYATSSHDASNPRLKKYLRPRTILTRLANAAGTSGEILSITPPFTNATYELQFFGPVVKCKDANDTVTKHIEAAMERTKSIKDNPIMEIANNYFSMVPDLSAAGLAANEGVVQVANHTNTKGAENGSNQLWLRFDRYVVGSDRGIVLRPHQLQCQLYNTTYEVSISFVEGVQSLTLKNDLKPLNSIDYPRGGLESDEAQMNMAYTAFMWVLTDQLTGSIAFYRNISTKSGAENDVWSEINSDIQTTALLGSSDLQSFFDYNRNLYPSKSGTGSEKVSDQRAEDIAFAKNRTLDALIEELSSNMTLSLMNSDLLSPSVPVNVTTTTPLNVYAYNPKNLYMSYGIALLFALSANILGAMAYISNGVSHNNSFSSIVRATRNPELLGIPDRKVKVSGAMPLDKQTGQTILRLRDDGFVICHK